MVGILKAAGTVHNTEIEGISTQLKYSHKVMTVDHDVINRKVELLIIPPTNPSSLLKTFIHGQRTVIHNMPVDPYVEFFVEYMLPQYEEIPVFFMGNSTVYAANLLNGKTAVTTRGFYFLPFSNEVEIIIENNDQILGFGSMNIYGFLDYKHPKCYTTILEVLKVIEKNINNPDLGDNLPLEDVVTLLDL